MRLPKAAPMTTPSGELTAPSNWFENSLSGIGTIVLHLVVIIIFALIPWGSLYDGQWGDGDDIIIGQLPNQQLVDNSDEQLDSEQLEKVDAESKDTLTDDIRPPSASDELSEMELDVQLMAPSGGVGEALSLEAFSKPKMESSSSENFGELISRLKKDGLDIVITFDSTGSMSGEISEVKSKIERIGHVLMKLVPKTRISVCTYRDKGEDYVVRGLKLTDNITEVADYLSRIRAAGGGDTPEAVDAGLEWAIKNNKFRRNARKVILIFGDAPPHANKKREALKLASEFRRKQRGVISTITCDNKRLAEFVEIAQMGGGESFLTRNEKELMAQLMVLVFGSRHRNKVLQAFDLLER